VCASRALKCTIEKQPNIKLKVWPHNFRVVPRKLSAPARAYFYLGNLMDVYFTNSTLMSAINARVEYLMGICANIRQG
jgi:hypothetical protein